MIDLIDLCQQSDMAISTSCNFVGGAGKRTRDCIVVAHHPAQRENDVRDAGTTIDGTALGLQSTQVSYERFPTTMFTANPLLNTKMYNYNLLQLCKEVTFQKGLLISHS